MRKPIKRIQDSEQLKIDNEIRKLKMQLEYGGGFHNPDPYSTISPHIEKLFLDQVEEFHKAHNEAKKIKLYEFIGSPVFKKADTLSDAEIKFELKNIKGILVDNFIMCDCVYETDVRALYTFITEELFTHEIDDVRIPGMVLHIIYEEFHPNHECDIEQKCIDFINIFLTKDFDQFIFEKDHDVENLKQLNDFRNAFESFDLKLIEQESITINEDKAEAVFLINFSATIEGSASKESFVGLAHIYLNCRYEWWTVSRALMPGMTFQLP